MIHIHASDPFHIHIHRFDLCKFALCNMSPVSCIQLTHIGPPFHNNRYLIGGVTERSGSLLSSPPPLPVPYRPSHASSIQKGIERS